MRRLLAGFEPVLSCRRSAEYKGFAGSGAAICRTDVMSHLVVTE